MAQDTPPPISRAPHPREAQIFPRLAADVIDRLRPYGVEESPAEGAQLFTGGERAVDFFVVLEGAIELLNPAHPEAGAFRIFERGQFSGEVHLFSDRAVLITGRAAATTRVLRLPRHDFQRMVANEADIGEMIMRSVILRRVELIATGYGGTTLVGAAHAPDTHRVRAFLTRNHHPYRLLDIETDPAAAALVDGLPDALASLPLVLAPGGKTLRNPSTPELAAALGLDGLRQDDALFDVAIVGAGPAGLAAAVYAASEGLRTIVIEAEAAGGQAGTSSRIENYLGFPTGISGEALAGRALVQAQKFGARLAISRPAISLDCSSDPFVIGLEPDEAIRAKSIVVASGARYRRLSLDGYDQLEGRGIYYAATPMEAQLCADQEAIVVGGGNSAGQAAVFLSRTCRHVHVLVRGPSLAATMSDYLVQRIENSPSITLRPYTEVTAVEGEGYLSHVTWTERRTGQSERRAVGCLFVMIGAEPNTAWLRNCVPLDAQGFVLTGQSQASAQLVSPYATALPGVFAIGDVRSGSIKRVASGVGEGSVVISAVHRYLAGEGEPV
jgi:thioredoxin reductase (NADPH)